MSPLSTISIARIIYFRSPQSHYPQWQGHRHIVGASEVETTLIKATTGLLPLEGEITISGTNLEEYKSAGVEESLWGGDAGGVSI